MAKIKHYKTEDLTVIWNPEKCIHAGECVKGSPTVFHPNDRPWIQLDGADPDDVRKTIDKCPSGALSYPVEETGQESSAVRIRVVTDGPLLFKTGLELETDSGDVKTSDGPTTALCRCGASENKPFCDGSHKTVGFQG